MTQRDDFPAPYLEQPWARQIERRSGHLFELVKVKRGGVLVEIRNLDEDYVTEVGYASWFDQGRWDAIGARTRR